MEENYKSITCYNCLYLYVSELPISVWITMNYFKCQNYQLDQTEGNGWHWERYWCVKIGLIWCFPGKLSEKYNLNEKYEVWSKLLTGQILDLQQETTGVCNSIVLQHIRVRVAVTSVSGIAHGHLNRSARIYCTFVIVTGRQVVTVGWFPVCADLQHVTHSVKPYSSVQM